MLQERKNVEVGEVADTVLNIQGEKIKLPNLGHQIPRHAEDMLKLTSAQGDPIYFIFYSSFCLLVMCFESSSTLSPNLHVRP